MRGTGSRKSLATENDILSLIRSDQWRMGVLQRVHALALPDCWVAAGFVRNAVWDAVHGYSVATPLNDVDVVYFDVSSADEAFEKVIEERLQKEAPELPWSVKNQARMHLVHPGTPPYQNTADAVAHWVETATCIGVRFGDDDELQLLAPHGIDDLLGLLIKPGPFFHQDDADFQRRWKEKGWLERWPKLRVLVS